MTGAFDTDSEAFQLPASYGEFDEDVDPSWIGQSEWTHRITALHRMLANPSGEPPFKIWRNSKIVREESYWEALNYLLRMLVGWTDVGRGLARFYESGFDTMGDPRLAAVQRLWNDRGQLDLYADWLWSGGVAQRYVGTVSRPDLEDGYVSRHDPGPEFWHRTDHVRSENGSSSPWIESGTNPHHLGHSWPAAGEPAGTGHIGITDHSGGSAAILLPAMAGWYTALDGLASELPDRGGRSWRVDVVAKPVGWLGEFRKSRTTGLWFLGRHRVHEMGQRPR
jgi:hypothetical protein